MAEENKTLATTETKKVPFSDGLTTSLMKVKDSLPQGFNIDRFVNNAVALLNENKPLEEFCKKNGTSQVKQGLMKSAFLGLDAMNKECYLIPYGNKLQFQIDYRGAEKLAKKYSIRPILDITSEIVRQGDNFKNWSDDNGQHFEFIPMPFNDGAIIGAFAVCKFADGGIMVDTMSLAELENSRKQSKASNSPAWQSFTGEMYKKTVIHRLCKHIEIDFENPNQRNLWDNDMLVKMENEKATESVPDPTEDVPADVVDVEVVEG